MKLKIFTVDAFTSTPFSGNPAAVVPLDEPLSEVSMQKIAVELNLSETAYLTRLTEGSDWLNESKFGLRWFTPKNEVILCGHATLASAHAIFQCMGNTSDRLEFETLSGTLLARRNKAEETIILDFPNNKPTPLTKEQEALLNPLVEAVTTVGLPVKDVQVSASALKLLVRIEDAFPKSKFESLRPTDSELLSLHDGSVVKGIILTMKGDRSGHQEGQYNEYDFVSRYLAPWNGISEDPVTGSAHTVAGPYWAQELNKKELYCRQCSARGGDLTVTVREDGRVDLAGKAVTVITGHINV